MKTKTSKRQAGRPATSWKQVPAVIDARPAEYQTVAYGISRSLCGRELMVDFGDGLGDIAVVAITFHSARLASAAYCKGIKLEVKIVAHPEHTVK